MSYENEIASEIRDFILDLRSAYEGDWLPRIELILAQAAALQARIDGLETENIVATEGKYARTEYMSYWTYDELLIRAQAAEAQAAALQARVAELEAENLDLISEIVQTDCRDYGRGEYQTGSSTNQELIDRLVAAGRMRHKRSDHKDRPIYEFVHVSSKEAPAA